MGSQARAGRSLTAADAEAVADTFGLGGGAGTVLEGPVDRGELGQVWRLRTPRGSWAVKETFAALPPAQIEVAATFQARAVAYGITAPASVPTVTGASWAAGWGHPVRVFAWVDLGPPDRSLDPGGVGRVLAALHAAGGPVPAGADPAGDPWFSTPVGQRRWDELVTACTAAGAPFAARLAAAVPGLLAAEAVFAAPDPAELRLCHRDLWADNVRPGPDGPVVIDWDNCGAATFAGELAMVVAEFALDPVRARVLVQAYADAGGPGRIRDRSAFTMTLAVLGHVGELGCRQWLTAAGDAERDRARRRVEEFCATPLTLSEADAIVASVADVD